MLEFLFTYSSAFLILDASYQSNITEVLLHSLGKIFLINPYDIFVNSVYVDYKSAMSNLNPLADRMGLGGSLLTEIIAFKNIFVIVLIPFFLVFYGFIINYFLKSNLLWLKIYGILFILFIFNFFRGSMFDHLFYPFQLMLYFGIWIFVLDVIYIKNKRKLYE
ncbi:MAG: hypothetical protein L3I99_05465 [Sulfurimonas sp.]|nr:hypothetical protein [Sulfurimonas sp.]